MKLHLFFIYLFILNISTSFASECEDVENPKGFSDCSGKKAEANTEICCYAKGKQNGLTENECLDIASKDAETQEKLNEAINKIKKGEYWPEYPETYEELDLVCNSKSNAKYLNGFFAILVFCLLF